RVMHHLTPEEIRMWKNWYRNARPIFVDLFGEKYADSVIRGFAVSQANPAPDRGLQIVLQVLDDIRMGRVTTNKDKGTVAITVRHMLEHGYADKGVAQK